MNQDELPILLEVKYQIADLPIYRKLLADGVVSPIDLSSDNSSYLCRFWFDTGFFTQLYARGSNIRMIHYRIYSIGLDNDTLRINIEHRDQRHCLSHSKSINYKYDPRKQILLLKTSLHDMDVISKTIKAIQGNLTLDKLWQHHAKNVHKRTK